jgi:hypothetical protein
VGFTKRTLNKSRTQRYQVMHKSQVWLTCGCNIKQIAACIRENIRVGSQNGLVMTGLARRYASEGQ